MHCKINQRVHPVLHRASQDPTGNDGGGEGGGRRGNGGTADPAANAPIFNLPPMVRRLIGLNVAVHAARYFIADDTTLVEALGFLPARYGGSLDDGTAAALDRFGWTALVAPITYQFLHGGVAHLVLNMVSLAAFGTAVERRLGGRRMLAFYLLTGLAAALAHWASDPASPNPVIGASGAISGVFAGALLLLRELGQFGTGRRQLFLIIGLWLAMTVLTGSSAPPGTGGAPVAWIAHIGGFVAGLALWPLFARRPR